MGMKFLKDVWGVFGSGMQFVSGSLHVLLIVGGVLFSFIEITTSVAARSGPFWGIVSGVCFGCLVFWMAQQFTPYKEAA